MKTQRHIPTTMLQTPMTQITTRPPAMQLTKARGGTDPAVALGERPNPNAVPAQPYQKCGAMEHLQTIQGDYAVSLVFSGPHSALARQAAAIVDKNLVTH